MEGTKPTRAERIEAGDRTMTKRPGYLEACQDAPNDSLRSHAVADALEVGYTEEEVAGALDMTADEFQHAFHNIWGLRYPDK